VPAGGGGKGPRRSQGKIINGGEKFFANTFSRLINFGSAVASSHPFPSHPLPIFVLFYYHPFFKCKVLSLTVLGLLWGIMHTSLDMRESRHRKEQAAPSCESLKLTGCF